MKAISLFSGIGGLDRGFERAGFEIEVCIDADPLSRLMCRRQFPAAIVPEDGDITNFNWGQISPNHWRDAVVIAGPPCQPFSRASSWLNGDAPGVADARARVLDNLLERVQVARPVVVIIENVPAFANSRTGGLNHLLGLFAKLQGVRYQLSWAILRAENFGVPQLRSRFFLVASRVGEFSFNQLEALAVPRRSVWDVLEGVEVDLNDSALAVTGKWAALLPSIPPGCNYLFHSRKGGGHPVFGWRTKFWNFLQKLHPCKPSWTLTASPGSATGPFHWENRRLALSELSAIQTLPSDLDFRGISYRAGVRLVGNAVPSLLGEFLARAIAEQLFGSRFINPPNLSFSKGVPIIPCTATVPAEYLWGTSPEDHPGPGRGPLWSKRRSENPRQVAAGSGAMEPA